MYQSLRGIRLLLRVGHTSTVNDCSCRLTLSRNRNRILDSVRSLFLTQDSVGPAFVHEHLEGQISTVFHTAMHFSKLVGLIHDRHAKRTMRIIPQLLLRQDNRVDRPWSNEETIMFLHKYNSNPEFPSELVDVAGGESDHITDTLTTKVSRLYQLCTAGSAFPSDACPSGVPSL